MKSLVNIQGLLFILLMTLLSASCQKGPTLTICGKIPNAANKMVYIDSITGNGTICLDSTLADTIGRFSIERRAAVRMSFFQLRVDSMSAVFCADSTKKVVFSKGIRDELSLTGDEYAAQVCMLSQHIRATNKYIRTLMKLEKKCINSQIKDLIYIRVMQYREIADSLVKANPVAPVAYYAMNAKLIYNIEPYDFNDPDDRRMLAIVANGWNIIRHDNVYSNHLLSMLENTKLSKRESIKIVDNTKYSEKASFVNLDFPNKEGKQISLNSIKDKNIILLFWDLRMIDNDVLSRIQDYYQANPDLEIYHVNYYKDMADFKEDAAKCPWMCVNDETGTSLTTYNLEVTPSVFLFNKKGNIVGKNVPFIGYKF